jgi:hypothetical protein
MGAITKQEAQQILQPYIATLRNSVKTSVNKYYSGSEFAPVRHLLSKRSDASNCHDLIVDTIKNEFDNTSRTHYFYKNNLFLLTIEGRIALRFKMFDLNLLSHGIATQQLISFNNQEIEQIEFNDMPPDGLLHVGYCVNPLRTGVENVHITYRYGNNNLWEWDITEEQIAQVKQIELPNLEKTHTSKRKVMPKNRTVGDINEVK